MEFANPYNLYLLILLLPLIGWYIYKLHHVQASFKMSTVGGLKKASRTWKVYLRHFPFILRLGALAAIIIVLARPQSVNSSDIANSEGIDIVMAIDVSGTMLAQDFAPNRLEAAKKVAAEFITDRKHDNIGLVIFAGESFTQCPLTIDHRILLNLLKDVRYGYIEDGTAIGMGLANSVNRLKDSKSKSRVVILLTDGSNNAGQIAPLTAAELAVANGIRVYTIGIGSKGPAIAIDPTTGQRGYIDADIDEKTLQQIAEKTRGEYYRATDMKSLKAVYEQIDSMEKYNISVNTVTRKKELFFPFAILALGLIAFELLLRRTLLRTIP